MVGMHHVHDQQPSVRATPPPQTSNFLHPFSHENTSVGEVAGQHKILPCSTIAVQNITPPNSQAPFIRTLSTSTTRPPHPHNPCSGSLIRSMAPHLRPFKPLASSQQLPPQPIRPFSFPVEVDDTNPTTLDHTQPSRPKRVKRPLVGLKTISFTSYSNYFI